MTLQNSSIQSTAAPVASSGRVRTLYRFDNGHIFTSSRIVGTLSARYYATVVVACDDNDFRVSSDQLVARYRAVAIRPGVKHEIHAEGGRFVLARFAPIHPLFKRCCRIGNPGTLRLDPSVAAPLRREMDSAFDGRLNDRQAIDLFARLHQCVSASLPYARRADARISRAVLFLASYPNCSQAELAAHIGVSVSRFSHLFHDAVGICMKTYRCWQRMRGAMDRLESGVALTDIVIDAGYSDLSHFWREFRDLSGAAPSRFLHGVRIKNIESESIREAESCPAVGTSSINHTLPFAVNAKGNYPTDFSRP